MGTVIKLPERPKSGAAQILEELLDLAEKTDIESIVFVVEFQGGATRAGAAGRYLQDLPAGLHAAQMLERRLRWESSMSGLA